MGTGIMSIGVTGMQAAQLGLLTTQHNIANASTAGYSRQRTVQATNNPVLTGSGAVGQGVHVTTISRMYSSVLNSQVVQSQASVSELDTYYSQISQIDNLLSDTSSGVSAAIQSFFSGVQEVASDPSSLDARQAMVSSAQALASRFNTMSSTLSDMYDGVNAQISSNVDAINSYSQQIASLNERIIVAQSSTNQPANDLLDQRDELVNQLNKLIAVKTSTQSNGSYTVSFGTGQPLVVGTTVTTLTATASNADPERIVVGIKNSNTTQELPEFLITGGALGGLIKFRNESLEPAMNKLGLVAASLAQTYNAQNALGQDLLGNNADVNSTEFQSNLFVIEPDSVTGELTTTPKVISNANNSTSATLTASFSAVTLDSTNTNYYSKLTGSDYRLDFDGTNYSLTRLTDGRQWTDTSASNLAATVSATEGITFDDGGTMSSGDSFLIQPTRDIAKNLTVNTAIANDPRLIAAAAPIMISSGTANMGSASITSGTVSAGYAVPAADITLTCDTSGTPPVFYVSGLAGTTSFTYSAGSTVTLSNGISFAITGAPDDGDTFVISANTGGVADGRNAVLLGKLQTQNTVSGDTSNGTATYASSYAQLVSVVGSKTNQVEVTLTAQQSLLEQATNSRDALSGVNLDEEAANLLSYQQAYQASAKMLQIAAELFDTLLSIGA